MGKKRGIQNLCSIEKNLNKGVEESVPKWYGHVRIDEANVIKKNSRLNYWVTECIKN